MMESTDILHAWISDLQNVLDKERVTVNDVRIGVFYTAVQLSDGDVGVAFTPRGLTDSVCCPQSASGAPPAGRLARASAWSLAKYALSPTALRRAVGVATLNALSALAMVRHEPPEAQVLRGVDALDAAGIDRDDRVVLVGAFVPFIKKLKHYVSTLRVIDKHPEALKTDEIDLWCPPEKAGQVLSEASLVIMTGSTLVEGGTDDLLKAVGNRCRLVMAGPTASPWPPTFFARRVDVLAGIRVTDGPRLLEVVSQGGSGYFFGDGAEKISVVRNDGTDRRAGRAVRVSR